MPKPADVTEVVGCFMSRVIIQPVVAYCSIGAPITIGVVIAKTTLGDIECSVVVTVEIQTIGEVISISVDLRDADAARCAG